MYSILQHRLARLHPAGVLVPIAYFLIGAALYGATLRIFFMSDDFEFLEIVAQAHSVSVVFEPLVGRFVRPLVVLMYFPAVQLVKPDVAMHRRALVVATQSLGAFDDETRVTGSGDRRFHVDLGNNRLLQPQIPSSVHYRIESQTSGSYHVQFGPSVKTGLVLYLTHGRLESAGAIEGPGLPFGQVDVPSDDARCEGDSISFVGWALDNDGISRVVLQEIEPDTSGGGHEPALLGEAAWAAPGARPDVARMFAGYPGAERAAWVHQLSCARVASRPAGAMRVRVIACDTDGHEAVIGERVVRAAQ